MIYAWNTKRSPNTVNVFPILLTWGNKVNHFSNNRACIWRLYHCVAHFEIMACSQWTPNLLDKIRWIWVLVYLLCTCLSLCLFARTAYSAHLLCSLALFMGLLTYFTHSLVGWSIFMNMFSRCNRVPQKIVAKTLDGQRYPLPLCEYMWVCVGERGSGPNGADDLCFISSEA